MSESPEQNIQVDAAQAQVGGPDVSDLQNQIELLKANNQKLLSEKKNATASQEDLQRQIKDLQTNQQKAKQSQLAEAGEFKTLWQEATGTVSSLQDQIAGTEATASGQGCSLPAAADQISRIERLLSEWRPFAGAHVHPDEREPQDEGRNLVALHGGVEVPLNDHLESLKGPGSGMDYFFAGSGARGMSAAGSSSSTAGGKSWSGNDPDRAHPAGDGKPTAC